MTLDLQKGDNWPFRSSRGLTGAPCDPAWYALITAPQGEAKAASQLKPAGCEAQFPTYERFRKRQGRDVRYEVLCVPRIIYARFRFKPHWDVMRERRVIMGVFSRNGKPIVLSNDDVARVMGLPTEAERLEQEAREASRPVVGGRAEITDGPLSGFFVDVTRVEYGRAWFETITGVKGSVPLDGLRRAAE